MEDPTPAGEPRDRLVDAARALSVCLVVLFHAGLWRVTHDAAGWNAHTMDLGPIGWYGGWVLMVMPLFFVTGGFGHAVVIDRMLSRGTGLAHYYASRGRRLVGPTAVFVTVFAVPSSIAAWAGGLPQADFISHNLTKLLWFLVSYLVVVLLAPAMVWLHDCTGLAPLVVMATAGLLVDLHTLRTGNLDFRYLNLAFVWLACHQLGIGYRRGFLRSGPRWHATVAIGMGIAGIVVLLHGGWPLPALGMGPRRVSNLQPPTVAMVFLALSQTGLLGLLSRRQWRMLARPRVQHGIDTINALLMTIYLWHMPCVVLGFGIGMGISLLLPAMATAATLPPATLAVTVVLLVLVVPRVARLDLRLVPPLGARQNGPAAVAALVVLTVALVGVWRHGLVVDPREPRSSLGVLGIWGGSALLAWAANRPAARPGDPGSALEAQRSALRSAERRS